MPRLSTAVVFAMALMLFGLQLGSAALWDNDETIYTQIARELVQSSDWITLHWRGQPWFVHPPLHFWLVALFSIPLGMTEVAARLPAVIFGAACVALVEMWGRTLFSPRAGLIAAAALALNFQFFVESRLANMDTTILFFVTLSLFGFWRACEGQPSGWYLMFVASGLACLSKGPLGLVLPWMIVLPLLALTRQLWRLWDVPWLGGGLLAAVIGLSWYAVELSRHGRAFGESVFVVYTLNRLTTRVMNQGGPAWLYLPIMLVGMFPWSLMLPQALAGLWPFDSADRDLAQGQRADSAARNPARGWRGRLIVLWVVVPFVLFSAAVSKLPNYILFVYPGAALAVGRFIDRALLESPARLLPAMGTAAAAALLAGAAIPLWIAPRFSEYSWETWRVALMLVSAVAAGGMGAIIALSRGAATASVAALASGMAAFLIGCAFFLTPQVERYRPIKPLALAVNQAWRPGDRLMIHALPGHGLEFYTGQAVGVIEDEPALKPLFAASPELLMIVPTPVFDRLARDGSVIALATAGNAVLAASRERCARIECR